ncbi:hypothetical protein Slin15195_G100820 [Septoria linicola]|uniref:Uncharacterized protein n=1 Tax=Septoria linicola TaxID=215465 RepID=A0A9Q9EPQ3_9PEZI|nr:hypothetical protein Slin14017_G063840 [Septoria linicola]USW56763.1 hypothetical protein Slin15195_G100820 [Septoria linicola]
MVCHGPSAFNKLNAMLSTIQPAPSPPLFDLDRVSFLSLGYRMLLDSSLISIEECLEETVVVVRALLDRTSTIRKPSALRIRLRLSLEPDRTYEEYFLDGPFLRRPFHTGDDAIELLLSVSDREAPDADLAAAEAKYRSPMVARERPGPPMREYEKWMWEGFRRQFLASFFPNQSADVAAVTGAGVWNDNVRVGEPASNSHVPLRELYADRESTARRLENWRNMWCHLCRNKPPADCNNCLRIA